MRTQFVYAHLALILVAGCGGVPSPGAETLLAEGIYTGDGTGSMVFTGSISGSRTIPIPVPVSVEISGRGIPVIDGAEAAVGDVYDRSVGGYYLDSTVTFVSRTADGIRLRFDDTMSVDITVGGGLLWGSAMEVYKRVSSTTIEWELSRLLRGFVGGEMVTVTVSGSAVYTR